MSQEERSQQGADTNFWRGHDSWSVANIGIQSYLCYKKPRLFLFIEQSRKVHLIGILARRTKEKKLCIFYYQMKGKCDNLAR